MNLTEAIESAEKQYKQILEDFFISFYNEKSLSSHGIDHHRRVWNYSKELLKFIPLDDSSQTSRLVSELIIASYLHDTGMSVDPGPRHGKHSRNLCLQFLVRNNLPENDYKNTLDAIEYHDNKNYSDNIIQNDLLKILSVSDDLDAFGYTGVFRYTEIYMTREIRFDMIGYMIRENARKRYDNFIKTFGSVDELVVKHGERYYLLDMFFSKYNEQLPFYQFGTEHPSGFCGVVEVFTDMIKKKIELKEIYIKPDTYMADPLIRWFFIEFEKELSCI
jgi:HD superfamily phosphodiesterase